MMLITATLVSIDITPVLTCMTAAMTTIRRKLFYHNAVTGFNIRQAALRNNILLIVLKIVRYICGIQQCMGV
jgi:hypothetical protein